MDKKLKIQVIIGSTRSGRFSEKPARWIYEEVKKREGIDAELVDLRDYPLPFYNEAMTPKMLAGKYSDEVALRWAKKVGEADGYVIATPEYNHGYPAVLKNAMDYVYNEWNRKAVGFVSWGSVGGARAIEQLRGVAVELQMAPVRNAVHIQWPLYMAVAGEKGDIKPELFEPVAASAAAMIDDLLWWAKALKNAR